MLRALVAWIISAIAFAKHDTLDSSDAKAETGELQSAKMQCDISRFIMMAFYIPLPPRVRRMGLEQAPASALRTKEIGSRSYLPKMRPCGCNITNTRLPCFSWPEPLPRLFIDVSANQKEYEIECLSSKWWTKKAELQNI
ncbi:hypothetical protein QBC46DRAFT_72794 [Diplogelasinospora grovesii]|uniref:Uncharacterized protein n=1 Tax=Diplogelasinospora grovesii TaxID=303347 RepID=A0AAN6NE71_9PEZI|nr:hypothetical protein QBC46DRAFT_72794 [Diplogelasinospora grovesii]